MATKKDENEKHIYVRNARPNRVAFTYDNLRYKLERRGSREDTTSLPADAQSDPILARWLKGGVLEKITRESFIQLAKRTVDVEPRYFLKRKTGKDRGVVMSPAEGDATKSLTQLAEKDVRVAANPGLEWAGELMTTEEELETMTDEELERQNYPSRHRSDFDTRQMGY